MVTDTRLPCGPPSPDAVPMVGLKTAAAPAPVYARCRDANEVWLPLLEKAAAKLAGSYEALHSGSIAEGLVCASEKAGKAKRKGMVKSTTA